MQKEGIRCKDRHPVYPQSLGSPVGIRGTQTGTIDNNPTYPKFIIIQTSDITDLFSVLNGK